jgi:hypothetical protein
MNKRLMRYITPVFLLAAFVLSALLSQAQISTADTRILEKKEDTLAFYSRRMVFDEEAANRFRSDSIFVRTFVRALLVPNSFYYAFDSLNISKLYSPDSAFRIFTWQMKKDEYVYMQKGAIQVKTANGSLKLYPLFDVSMYSRKPQDSVRSKKNWIGAIYYKIILKEANGRKYYTLLGFDDYSVNSNKKWMEVLTFDKNGEPVFGGPVISYKNDSLRRPTQARFSIEYKKEAKTFLNYDQELDVILVDHLVSESDEPEKKFTLVPDGDYEAFKWDNGQGQWVHINKMFNQMLKDGDFPKDAMMLDDKGNIDERKLEEASRRNMEKEKADKEKAKKAVPPKKKDN